MERSGLVESLVGMSAKVITLCLQQVSGQSFSPISIVVGQGRCKGRNWNAEFDGFDNHAAPGCLGSMNRIAEIRSQQEIFKVGIGIERFFDAVKKTCSNDASASP